MREELFSLDDGSASGRLLWQEVIEQRGDELFAVIEGRAQIYMGQGSSRWYEDVEEIGVGKTWRRNSPGEALKHAKTLVKAAARR